MDYLVLYLLFNSLLNDTSITHHTRLVAIDRSGYGYTQFGRADTSILHQSKLILKAISNFLPKIGYSVLGRSFGGSIAACIAGIDTQGVKKLILISSSLGPRLEKTYPISYTIDQGIFRLFFLGL